MKLCVLIPAFNEAKVIRRTILSAYGAGADSQDVYVVDDGSKDDTAEVARQYKAQVFSKPNGGKAVALQSGVEHFRLAERYTHVAILDADSTLDVNYISEMSAAIESHPDAVLFCGSPRSAPHNWLTAYRAVEYGISQGIYREAQSFMGTIMVAPGCASIYCLKTFASLDFTGGTLVEDMDLTIQLQRRKEKLFYVPDALVYTQDPRTVRGFVGQISRWYRGTWQVVRKHRLARRAQGIDFEVGLLLGEGLLYSALMFLVPFFCWWTPRLVLTGLAFDQVMLLTFTLLVAVRERRMDVIAAFPRFIVPRALNFMVFTWAFLVERRPQETKWFSVARY